MAHWPFVVNQHEVSISKNGFILIYGNSKSVVARQRSQTYPFNARTNPTNAQSKMSEGLTTQQKRSASCKAVGGEKKRRGHKLEHVFNAQFGDPLAPLTYKAEADSTILNKTLQDQLRQTLGWTQETFHCSLKSGKNLQFTLGSIPEITDAPDKVAPFRERALWERYLMKHHSATPADFLVYYTETHWKVFRMDEVVTFLCEKGDYRLLDTGRVKGDFADDSRAGKSQYLTYEYRPTHKSYFLGANGGKGEKWIELLSKNIRFMTIPHAEGTQ